jgi:Kef-type K+ transport system membrane component KefB
VEPEQLLTHLVVVLVAAKFAAEVCDRIRLPAVVGEIVVGVVIGPSVLGIVHHDDVLRALGELGVLLLLLEVGLQMDLRELASVGRASFMVAVAGIVAPFALGYGVAASLGLPGNTAIFLGAALTATSVGITARVFGDLRALAMTEARTVLGAAVADDVLGLVVLTVVVRIVAGGQVDALLVGGTLALAVGFLVVVGGLAARYVPAGFRLLDDRTRTAGALVVLALAFAFGIARLAAVARLAPIVGAFVAGLALARSDTADDVRREIAPLGHVLVPVFFVLIGVDVRVGELLRPSVLALAGGLLVVAVLGKLVSGLMLRRGDGDRLLVGLGMLPRGEVGLIFATIGLQAGVLAADAYAALLVVVLVTTLVTPPLLRLRLVRVRATHRSAVAEAKPAGGWLVITPDVVDLAATPPERELLHVTLQAAALCVDRRPGDRLLRYVAEHADTSVRWESAATAELFVLLRTGTVRSWRFLEATGLLERALPELAATARRRRSDPADLDPAGALNWSLVDAVRRVAARDARASVAYGHLPHPEWLLLAALVIEATDDERSAVVVARRLTQRLGLGAAAEQHVATLVSDRNLLPAAARRADALAEEAILELAVHLRSRERLDALYVLSVADGTDDTWERGRLDAVAELVGAALRHPELTSREARNHVEERRTAAARLVAAGSPAARRVASAPRAYLLGQPPAEVARQAALLDPLPSGQSVRVVTSEDAETHRGRIDVVSRDAAGLLASVAGALSDLGVDVLEAVAATWPDGAALESFAVSAARLPTPAEIEAAVHERLRSRIPTPGVVAAELRYDDDASPWHTLCDVRAPDRLGLLHSVAAAFAAAGVVVHSARVSTVDGIAHDVFAVTSVGGDKLDDAAKANVAAGLRAGIRPHRRLAGRPHILGTSRKHPGHGVETASS